MQNLAEMGKINPKKILIISHKEHQCGVYQFGLNIAEELDKSGKYLFVYAECSSAEEYYSCVNDIKPLAIIYNHYNSITLPWLSRKVIQRITVPHIGIIHEVTQAVADKADDSVFDFHIAPDPTLILRNKLVFKTGRLVPKYENRYALPEVPTIGSFGFGTDGKGFEKLISAVQDEFDEAIIRLHIPFATFGDSDGSAAHAIAGRCKNLIVKPRIELQLSHEFLSKEQLLNFLAQNSLNAFFYDGNKGRGISSVIDSALAVKRPVAITKSTMFRHIVSAIPSICIEDSSLKQIMQNGFKPLARYYKEWSEANLIWDYERIIENVLSKRRKSGVERILRRMNTILGKVESKILKASWTPTLEHGLVEQQIGKGAKNRPISLPDVKSFNRILDNAARQQYKAVIDAFYDLLPEMMSRKIPEANIQQAFVFDTVHKFASRFDSPAMLCVGIYDDTAAAALKQHGYQMDEVDPVLNYDLNTFMHKPSTVKDSYDIIFSTSVIEHVKDDECFIKQIAGLLAPGGIAILTCDYNDQYQPGDAIPQEDFRFYTQKDFLERLLPLIKDCSLVDEPQWDCPNPDFVYAGCRYTFATFVFRKNKP
jgi:SAM-dependent methyltransferase